MTSVDFEALERNVDRLHLDYVRASPYPHVVIDGFLRPEAADAAFDAFDAIGNAEWTKYLHVNERKFANTDPETWGADLEHINEALQSSRFTSFLSRLSGIDDLIADPALDGGGLHRSTRGGYLNVHADFTAHHTNHLWRRRLNLILYLNRTWDESWGGGLQLWSNDMSRCEHEVVPVGNRAVIFTTSEDSFHGHPEPMTCPEGVFRQSLALYYFTAEHSTHVHATNYQPRPGDGVHSIAIVADREALRLYDTLKRRLHLSDDAVSTWLGRLDRLRPRRRHR